MISLSSSHGTRSALSGTVAANGLLFAAFVAEPASAAMQSDDTAAADTATSEPGDSQSADSKFFLWTDTSVSLLPYGQGFEVDPDEQSTFTIEHAHASKIGDMFMFVDFNQFHGTPSGFDNSTWYGEIGPRFSFGKMLGKDLSHTFFKKSLFEFKDVLLAMQYERGEDPDVAEAFLLGVGFDLDVREAGILGGLGKFNYVQMNLYARAEMTEGTESGFQDMQVTMVASYPFQVGRAQFLLDGYFDWVVGFGSEDWSYHLNPQLTMDVGAFWNHPKQLYAGIEVDLWWRKYQIPDSPFFDTDQAAVSLLLKYHF